MHNKNIDISFRGIFRITFPILLVTLTSYVMLVTDRLMLAKTSVINMNAVANSGNFVSIFTCFFNILAATSEVFVGQLNGDKQYSRLSEPVWQMFYFSLSNIFLFLLLAYFSYNLNGLPPELYQPGVLYQRTLLCFAFLPLLSSILAAFFVGQGETIVVSKGVILGCLANFFLDIWLIFGLNLGVLGAAVGTIIAQAVQVFYLGYHFFSKENRQFYGTSTSYSWKPKLLLRILKIGIPSASGVSFLLVFWWFIQIIVSRISIIQSTLYNLGISWYILLIFVGDGVQRSISTIAANLISANNLKGIYSTYRHFRYFITIFFITIFIIGFLFAKPILGWIYSLHPQLINFKYEIIGIFVWVTLNCYVESHYSMLWGILTAGGDTLYPIIVNIIGTGFLLLLPAFILTQKGILSSALAIYQIQLASLIFITTLYYLRFRSLKWYRSIINHI